MKIPDGFHLNSWLGVPGLALCTVNGKDMDAFVLPFSCLKHTLYCDCKENKNHNIIKRHTARLFLGLLTLDHHDND